MKFNIKCIIAQNCSNVYGRLVIAWVLCHQIKNRIYENIKIKSALLPGILNVYIDIKCIYWHLHLHDIKDFNSLWCSWGVGRYIKKQCKTVNNYRTTKGPHSKLQLHCKQWTLILELYQLDNFPLFNRVFYFTKWHKLFTPTKYLFIDSV